MVLFYTRIPILSLLILYLCFFRTFLNGFLLIWGSRGNLPFFGLVIFFTVAPNVFMPIHKSRDIPVVLPKAKECAKNIYLYIQICINERNVRIDTSIDYNDRMKDAICWMILLWLKNQFIHFFCIIWTGILIFIFVYFIYQLIDTNSYIPLKSEVQKNGCPLCPMYVGTCTFLYEIFWATTQKSGLYQFSGVTYRLP